MLKAKRQIILFLVTSLYYLETSAQCAMCRAVLETEEGQGAAKGINDGIVYLMVIPYVMVGVLGYIMYLKFFKAKKVN